MYLEHIKLNNFKNYNERTIEFSPELNCIVGKNGSGKTNLLDAVFYLSMSKSYFSSIDSQNIRHEEGFFAINGLFKVSDKKYKVLCSYQKGQKKMLQVNNTPYEKISEHIGRFPVVLIAPDDQDLVREGSETRRKFFDSLLSQIDHQYLQDLIVYYQMLKNRNALLKQFAERNYFDEDLLEPYTLGILQYGQRLFQKRKGFLKEFEPIFLRNHGRITDESEPSGLDYLSELEQEPFDHFFRTSLSRDRQLQRTTLGIHRDDYSFRIGDHALKKYGSQGQQKSFVVALKLAMFEILQMHKGFKPLLLLDDIFDKLDEQRINRLMNLIAEETFGQIFLTDAREERTQSILKKNDLQAHIIDIKNN